MLFYTLLLLFSHCLMAPVKTYSSNKIPSTP